MVRNASELENLKSLPQEKVYLHHSGPVIFSGEYFYYAFYCLDAQKSRKSAISTVGYIAVINDKNEYVLEQKIKLEKGLAQGDFFVNTDLPSGIYKILGYTQWMKNNGISQVFKDDLVIINPYKNSRDDIHTNDANIIVENLEISQDSATIALEVEKSIFKSRERVKLTLKNYKGQLGYGDYTIRVQKKEELPFTTTNTAIRFTHNYLKVDKTITNRIGDSIYLPEQRGELLYGTVLNANTKTPAVDKTVVISIPGEEFLLKFAKTDNDGNFYTYVKKDYKTSNAVFQVNDLETNYNIQQKTPTKLDVSDLSFRPLVLDKNYKNAILRRSIDNQLENQFFSQKPDSVLLGDIIDPFDGGVPETVYLDDYTRFKTLQETLVELLNKAGYRNNGKDADYIRIAQDFETFDEDYNSYPAIVLIDGVFIPNHEEIKDFEAQKIESISLIRDQFRLADKDYQGIMAIKTFEGDYFNNYKSKYGITAEIWKPIPKKNYYRQEYAAENNNFENIPDYRRILFWQPHIAVESNQLQFEFFTSDSKGEYEIILDGFTTYGKPIYNSQTIIVE
ncbi:hypothetical protein GCM10011414_14880 [Croceivirga lutea]|nr:hypothetical protein GCM10011414_14880 [Croceivirga lutea]